MQSCTNRARHSRAHCRIALALAALFALLTCSAAANAQEKKAPVASPGDTLTTPGPLAQNLSPKLDKRDLAKAMKLVADWQLSRMPADGAGGLDVGRALRRLHGGSQKGGRRQIQAGDARGLPSSSNGSRARARWLPTTRPWARCIWSNISCTRIRR